MTLKKFKYLYLVAISFLIVSNAFSQEVIKSSDLEVKFKEIYCLKDIKEDDCDEIFNKKSKVRKFTVIR